MEIFDFFSDERHNIDVVFTKFLHDLKVVVEYGVEVEVKCEMPLAGNVTRDS